MEKKSVQEIEVAYKLYRRFLSLTDCIMTLNDPLKNIGYVRYKPLFSSYNSCVKQFKKYYDEKYEQLELEDLPLYDERGQMLFTSHKLSTLLHQTFALIGFLEGELPPELLASKDRGTIVNISSFSESQAAANSVASLQSQVTLDSLYEVIHNTDLDNTIKTELLEDLENMKRDVAPDRSKLKAFAIKFVSKLQEIGENVANEVIYKLLSSKMGEM